MANKTPDPVDIYVGQRIRELRMRAGHSQTRLAKVLGMSFQQVQKYEKGVNRVAPSRLTKIAKLLGCTLAELLPPETGAPARDGLVDKFMATRTGVAMAECGAMLPQPVMSAMLALMIVVAGNRSAD